MRVALVVVGIAGCWTAPVDPVPVAAIASAPEMRHEAFPLHSVWRGTYRCRQGKSGVTLTIDAEPDGHAVARYDFGPVDDNPDVPVGAFELAGRLRARRGGFAGAFVPTQWIERPTDYFMVGLSIATAGHGHLRGTIDHDSCSDFDVERLD